MFAKAPVLDRTANMQTTVNIDQTDLELSSCPQGETSASINIATTGAIVMKPQERPNPNHLRQVTQVSALVADFEVRAFLLWLINH
jgi:hypothetical protein